MKCRLRAIESAPFRGKTDVLLHYYDAYLEHLNSNGDGSLPEDIPEDILDSIPGGIGGKTE